MNTNRQTLFNILISIVLLVTICGGGGLFLMNNSRGSNPAPVGPTVSVVDAAYTQAAAINNGQTATAVVNNALSAGGPTATSTLEPHEVIETNIALTFAAQTGIPTNTPTSTLQPSPTATLNPTITLAVIYSPTVVVNAPPTLAVSAPAQPSAVEQCPTDAEMQAAFGFTARNIKPVNTSVKSEGENCKWTLQAVGVYTFTDVPFLVNWQITDTWPDETIHVYYGDGVKRDFKGATFRYMPGYDKNHWVWDPEDLMAHEFNFGASQGRDPQYVTRNGNLNAPRWLDYDGTSCPANVVQLAGIVGGSYKQWTWRDWTGRAHVFNASPNQYILLTAAEFDGADAHLDYWNGQTSAADQLNNWNSLALNSASFHCHP